MDSAAATRASRLDRACLAVAFAIPVAWFFVYNSAQRSLLVDESGHLGNVYHFLEGKPGWPEQMTMLPGYHFIVAALWQLGPPITLITLARLVSTLFALLGIGAFAATWRQLHGAPSGRATLVFSLLPLLQPFTGMAYTDAPAMALVLLALAAHLRGRRGFAALLFVVAAFIRQTNLLWAAFVIILEWLSPPPAARERTFLQRTGWLWLLLGISALFVLWAGRVAMGTQTGTEMRPNIATLHCVALLVTLFTLPAWAGVIPAVLRHVLALCRQRPALAFAAIGVAAGTTAVLTRTYANSHPWNRDLSWEGNTFTLLRNWPLVWLERHPWLRVLSSLNIVAVAIGLTAVIAQQRQRIALTLAVGFGALLPAANNLVEPRYFIPGMVIVLLWLELRAVTERRLAAWWAVLCVAHAPFVARALSLW